MNLKSSRGTSCARKVFAGVAVLSMAAAMWRFPLVRVSRLDSPDRAGVAVDFDAVAYAQALWDDRLLTVIGEAPDAEAVLAALRTSPAKACSEFGRTVGVNRSCLYALQGRGTIVSVDRNSVGVSLTTASAPDVSISTGLIFGNAVRDAAGLVEASDFADSREFNALSEQLNRLVETRVIVEFKKHAAVGQRIQFAGCAEVKRSWSADTPLAIIPVRIEID